ncbi:hypothetical protein NBZ79_19140 [Sneathiella marina]|uniref:Uncharacterized protein n=1 Tax=Sneathiella marina TaxID=2950108 RepID=A0ABY4W378_9PROT|nr:hypothetical protein [Sneathiella marina]USG61276.1 hypothetical protein NBZ79_19140 [Sneathiella marina]
MSLLRPDRTDTVNSYLVRGERLENNTFISCIYYRFTVKYKRLVILIILYAALFWGGLIAGEWLTGLLNPEPETTEGHATQMMVAMTAIVFVVVSAIPFVPGAEIGLGLLMVMGTQVLFLVYFCMVLALNISFIFGRFVPTRATIATFEFFGLKKASDLAREMAPLSKKERLVILTDKAPRYIIPFLLKHRYLALAVALNIPGNTLIGGGGGIAFIAGLSGIYSFPAYILTILIAVAPVPLVFYFSSRAF